MLHMVRYCGTATFGLFFAQQWRHFVGKKSGNHVSGLRAPHSAQHLSTAATRRRQRRRHCLSPLLSPSPPLLSPKNKSRPPFLQRFTKSVTNITPESRCSKALRKQSKTRKYTFNTSHPHYQL